MTSRRALVAVAVACLVTGCHAHNVAAPAPTSTGSTTTPPPPSGVRPAATDSAVPSPAATSSATPSATASATSTPVVSAVVAASALDARRIGALVETCAGTSCHDRLDVSDDAGLTWRVGPVMPRYGPDNRLHGLLALDASHWYAYGTSGWFTADAGRTWRRSRGGYVVAAGRAGTQLWEVRRGCAPKCWTAYDLLNDDGSLGFLADLPWQTGGLGVSGALWTEDRAYVISSVGNTGRLLVLDHHLRLLATHPLPTPGGGVVVSVGSRSLDYLNAWGSAAGTQPKMFWHSDDDGRTWQRRPDPLLRGYGDSMVAAEPDLLWRYGYRSEIWRSTDDGRSWKPLLGNEIGDGGYELQAFTSYGRTAWAFAFVNDGVPAVFVTNDAGRRWSTVRLPASR